MDVLGIALTTLVIALLWVSAVLFGRDTRDGNDWHRHSTADDGLRHFGR